MSTGKLFCAMHFNAIVHGQIAGRAEDVSVHQMSGSPLRCWENFPAPKCGKRASVSRSWHIRAKGLDLNKKKDEEGKAEGLRGEHGGQSESPSFLERATLGFRSPCAKDSVEAATLSGKIQPCLVHSHDGSLTCR